jgi:GxxExxY protein
MTELPKRERRFTPMKPPRIHADTTSTETADAPLIDRELTEAIIGAFFEVCNELGYGFLESVYRRALLIALTARGLESESEAPIEVRFRGQPVGHFRADFVVAGRVIVEVKSIHALAEPEKKQLMNYLRATTSEVGLLLNFGPRPTFMRVVSSATYKRRPS